MMEQHEWASSMRSLAQFYYDLGFNVIPLDKTKQTCITGALPNGAVARFKWKDWEATRQPAFALRQILAPAWWTEVRGIALVCGAASSGLAVIDIDALRKKDPLAPPLDPALLPLALDLLGLPPDYAWRWPTPTGGYAVAVLAPSLQLDKARYDRPSSFAGVDHIELRFTGSYVVAPGSLHPNGGLYAWALQPPQQPPAAVAPDALLTAYYAITDEPKKQPAPQRSPQRSPQNPSQRPQQGSLAGASAYAARALADECAAVRATAEGGRNERLNAAAFALGQLAAGGELDEALAADELLRAALDAGLREGEATATIRSGLAAGSKAPRTAPDEGRQRGDGHPGAFGAETPDPQDLGQSPGSPQVDTQQAPQQGGQEGENGEEGRHRTWPYAERDGRLVYLREVRGDVIESPIADFTARNVEEIIEEDGRKTFTIVGSPLRGPAFRLEIDAETIGQPRSLRALLESAAGAKDPVYPAMTEHLPTAIKLMTRDEELRTVRRFRRTGWCDGRFLFPNRNAWPGNRIELDRKLPYGFDLPEEFQPDIGIALDALDHLVNAIDGGVALTVLTMLLQAPLQRLAGWTGRYGVFIQGRTGSLKTSFCQALMGIYGPHFADGDLLLKWGEGATRNAIMSLAARAHDLPLLIDNYKPNTGGGGRDFVALIHNILEGGDKDRLTSSAELRQARAVHCFPLMTGEDVPDQDAASVARVLVLPFPWQPGQPNELLAYAQERHRHLQAVGMTWLSWLEDKENHAAIRAVTGQLWSRLKYWAAELDRHRTGMANAMRVATNLAQNDLAFQVALLHPVLGPRLLPYAAAHHGGLLLLAQGMAQRTADALEAHQFLGALRELVATKQFILQPRPQPENDFERDRLLGWYDGDGVYLLPALAVAAAKRLLGPGSLPVSVQALYSQLEGLGKIASKDKQQNTKTVRIGTRAVRVIHLTLAALSTEDGSDKPSILEELGL